MNSEKQATFIKLAAVITAAPRWTSALIVSEGLSLPVEWLSWWRVVSFAMAAAMAFVEAFAFAYVLRAWREARADSPQAKRLMALIVLSAICFVAVMAPNVYASVQSTPLANVLSGVALWVWSIAVAASTILIVASVGYAQRRIPAAHVRQDTKLDTTDTTQADVSKSYACVDCGESFDTTQKYALHRRWAHRLQPSKNGQLEEVADRPARAG